MKHILDPLNKDRTHLETLFKSIFIEEAILFLGAGASITNKKYLSAQLIEYYENLLGQTFDTKDIVEFVDIMSANPAFKRADFDDFVQDLLIRLEHKKHHDIILSIKWREIITTNYDLLLEQAYDEIKGSSNSAFELIRVRNVKEYESIVSQDKVKYVKLNGCLSDKSKYKFVFSSDDFRRADSFYKKVLNPVKNLSPAVNMITVGYSYSDPLAKLLLERFDKYNYRNGKSIYSLDPYAPDYKLDYFTENRVCIIKMSAEDFFGEYKKWEEKNYAIKFREKTNKYTNKNNDRIQITNKLSYNLSSYVEQLNQNYTGIHIPEKEFYKGEEPNYFTIVNNHDIIRKDLIKPVINNIDSIIKNENGSNIIPIIFLTGSFGTGKTTFNYRLIHNLINDNLSDAVAFEIKEPESIKTDHVIDFVKSITSKHIIFYCNRVEVDSIYKAMIDLRLRLSMQQIFNKSIYFILSIRENILEKYKKSIHSSNIFTIQVDSSLNRSEIEELIKKLNDNQIISIRDVYEKDKMIQKIEKEYNSDTFTTMLDIISDGKHIRDLRDAYEELSDECQKAFIYTALVHRFNLLMPAGVLKNIVTSDWNEFSEKVIKVEGKGILIQEKSNAKAVNPDLYFKTKHPKIAENLIKEILKNTDTRFKDYTNIINNIDSTKTNGRFVINILKSLSSTNEFGERFMTKLYDLSYKKFQDDPYFILHYAINLQHRRIKDLTKHAIDLLIYAESKIERKDHKFIHRRAILNFEMAKFSLEEEHKVSLTLTYLEEAKDLFLLKRQLDPNSSYSYVDYINSMLWELNNISMSDESDMKLRIIIEDNLSLGLNTVTNGINKILEIEQNYISSYQFNNNFAKYQKRLDELAGNSFLIPYVNILKYNFLVRNNMYPDLCQELLEELWMYKDNDEVSEFLFREYGRKLNNPNDRMRFYELSSRMEWYEKQNSLRFNYFHYVAASYNRDFSHAKTFIHKIRKSFSVLNPEYKLKWLESDGYTERVFPGKIVKDNDNFYFKSTEFQKRFRFSKENQRDVLEGEDCKVLLCFYLNGIRALLLPKGS